MTITGRAAGAIAGLILATTAAAGCGLTLPASAPGPRAGATNQPPLDTKDTRRGQLIITGRGWGSSGINGPVPAPGTCHYRRVASSRDVLPDPACTPGAVDRAVSQNTLGTTVCRPGGYTDSVRPPDDLTEPVKRRLMAAYGIPADQVATTELDHLVPLGTGGSSDVRNLWPEPDNDQHAQPRDQYVLNDKDALENTLHEQLCYHHAALEPLQRAIARNWIRLQAQTR